MMRFIKNRLFVWLAGAWLAFLIVGVLIPRTVLLDVINGLAIAISVMFVFMYGPGALASLREEWRNISSGHFIATGMFLIWLGVLIRTVWNLVWRMQGRPEWMVDHLFPVFAVFILLTGGVLGLLYKDKERNFAEDNWRRLGVIAGISALVTLMLVTLITGGIPA